MLLCTSISRVRPTYTVCWSSDSLTVTAEYSQQMGPVIKLFSERPETPNLIHSRPRGVNHDVRGRAELRLPLRSRRPSVRMPAGGKIVSSEYFGTSHCRVISHTLTCGFVGFSHVYSYMYTEQMARRVKHVEWTAASNSFVPAWVEMRGRCCSWCRSPHVLGVKLIQQASVCRSCK